MEFAMSGKQRLIAMISLTLTVASFAASAACDPTAASLTSCTPPPPQGCAINPDVPCVDDRPDQDPQSMDALFRFYTEMDQDIIRNINVVPHSSSNTAYAACGSDYSTRLAYAQNDIAPYIVGKPQFSSSFFYINLVVTYPGGQHELWRVNNLTASNGQTLSALTTYFGPHAYLGSNAGGPIYLGRPAALIDPAPTCGT